MLNINTKIDRKERLLSVVAATAILSSTAFAMGNNLIDNGSFENFTIEQDKGNWKLVKFDNWEGHGEVWNHGIGKMAVDGTYKAELDVHKNSPNKLTQTIFTESGVKYLFSLDAYARKVNTSDFQLLVDDEVLATITPSNSSWEKYGVEFIGNGGEQTIAIQEIDAQDNGLGAVIDNVSVVTGVSLEQLQQEDRAKFEIIEPTGIDQILEIIDIDQVTANFVSAENRERAINSIEKMNSLIEETVIKLGLANDGAVTRADVREINLYLTDNYSTDWTTLYEDFKLLQPALNRSQRGAKRVTALNQVAINLWSDIYRIGLVDVGETRANKIKNYFINVGYRLGAVLQGDVNSGSLKNPNFQEVTGTTGTGMDKGVHLIMTESGLQQRVPTSDLRDGATASDEMNRLILEAIKVQGLANDGKISTADTRTINNYLVTNYQSEWAELHGDDENNEETGFHKVQNDGATGRMFADNFVNTVADGVYHLGFPTRFKNNLENEDGNKNQRFEKVAWWLNSCLKDDLANGTLANPDYQEVVGTTGTVFDKIVPLIYADEGLEQRVSMSDIREGAESANGMNELIVRSIKETGIVDDGYFSSNDIKELNIHLVTNYQSEWAKFHGDDEDGEETGYHKVQNDGATTRALGQNVLNQLADSVYHLGFPTRFPNNLENEDGNKNASFRTVAYWLNKTLQNDIAKGNLSN
jgi:hypothetical protein